MLLHVTCSSCGEAGSILVEHEEDIPRCPQCGHSLGVETRATKKSQALAAGIDDDIVSWLAAAPLAPERESVPVATCMSCGYEGLMEFDSDRGDTICPACLAVTRTAPRDNRRHVDCPGCGRSVDFSEKDQGKTIICPSCKYFLGCLIPAEKHSYRKRRARG
jgi:hypothetical protein